MSVFRHRFALRVAVAALALALLAYGLFRHAAAHPLAPPLPRIALRGSPVSLADLSGHPAVIAFWASWCTHCHTEAAALERFASSPAGRGRIVGVDDNDPVASHVRAFIGRYHWTFPLLSDPDSIASDAYSVADLPSVVIIDAKGRIVAHDYGPQTVASLDHAVASAG